MAGTSLVLQWLRPHAPKAGGLGLIAGHGTRSHTPLLKILLVLRPSSTKFFFFFKRRGLSILADRVNELAYLDRGLRSLSLAGETKWNTDYHSQTEFKEGHVPSSPSPSSIPYHPRTAWSTHPPSPLSLSLTTSGDHPPPFTQAPTAPMRSGRQASHPHGVPARKVITFHIHRVPGRFRAEKSLALELQGSRLSGTPLAETESWLASSPACPQLPAHRIQGAGDHLHQGLPADGILVK